MDVLLTANQSSLGQYYIAARQFSSQNAMVDFNHANVTAILEYRANYTYQTPPSFPTLLPMYMDYPAALNFTHKIRSLATPEYPVHVPLDITTRMYITVSMNSLNCTFPSCSEVDHEISSSLNNVSWINPNPRTTNVLQAYYRFFLLPFTLSYVREIEIN